MRSTSVLASLVLLVEAVSAFAPCVPDYSCRNKALCASRVDHAETASRRQVLAAGATMVGTVLLGGASPVSAKQSQEAIDKSNILKGYDRLQYLLNNWDKETTVCKIGGDSLERRCERTPIIVMEYLGYKATNDPLFKADKAMMRLLPLVPAEADVEFIEAVEKYAENAEEASGMAYISSWGEANPGGGKDRVELFIERSRKNVINARDSLGTVIRLLDLK